jgi:Na+/pantothenate symporter
MFCESGLLGWLGHYPTAFSCLQGGLKAVVWTDTLQQVIMMGSSIVVMVLGIVAVGGLDVVWQRNVEGDRIEFFKYVMGKNTSPR